MTISKPRLCKGLAVLPLAAVALTVPAVTAASAAPVFTGERVAVAPVPVLATQGGAPTFVREDPSLAPSAATATFKVTYHGFSAPAKAAFQRAVATWAQNVRSSVPITIDATYKPLGSGVLGSAGPSSLYRNFPGAPKKDVFYVDALTNKYYGSDAVNTPDIVANFSSAFDNWWFGTGPAPSGTYDFQSVVTHELGHGLGFLGGGYVNDTLGTISFRGGDGKISPSAYDLSMENAAGKLLTSFPDPSAALRTQLLSNKLVFDSPAVRKANGGRAAKVFAPTTWQPGSSYSHLDENTFRAGSPNSLMTPYLGDGESIRTPGAITKAVLATEGW